MNFSKQKNGYNEEEVDNYIRSANLSFQRELMERDQKIAKLTAEIEAVKSKEKSINLALTAAVDKAKEIEESSQEIYKLKLEQLGMLYTKWEILLNEMIKKNADIKDVSNIKEDMENLKSSIKTALKDDFNIELMTKTPATDPIRMLLNRLTGMKAEATLSDPKAKIIQRKVSPTLSQKTEFEKLEERASQIKPIANVKIDKGENYENPVDKFLSSDDEVDEKYSKLLNVPDYTKGDGKFDLNEAINPKEDLEEIMKSFDFYNEND